MNVSPMFTGALMPLPMANEIHHPVFDDIYFNPDDGIGESRYVFLSGIGVPDVWQGMGSYHITELGFGTGLNFCLTLGEWLRTAKPNEHLTYTGIDMYPLDIETLRRAGAAWPELKAEYEMLTSVYPGTAAGMTVVCALHSNSERPVLGRLKNRLQKAAPALRLAISRTDRDPFEIV